MKHIYASFIILTFLTSCKSSIKEQEDKIYSRHLQRHVALTIISTAMPDDKGEMNLLLFNNGQDLAETAIKKIIDSLYKIKLIQPLILVGIHGQMADEYGITDLPAPGNYGDKAGKYNEFIINELYPFIKKKSGVRKFKSVTISGSSLSGISALDIAWLNADKIDKVGIFSGNFNYADSINHKDTLNAVFNNIKSSRKRPKLKYWLYAGENNDTISANNAQRFAEIIYNKNTSTKADIQIVLEKYGDNNMAAWQNHFAAFLLWAIGR